MTSNLPAGTVNAAEEIIGRALGLGLGDQPALLHEGGSMTYGALESRMNRFGNAFKAAGVERENRILLLMSDTPDMVAAYLAAMKIGAVAVAFNVRCTSQDLLHVITDSRCKLLLIDDQFLEIYEPIAEQVNFPLRVVIGGDGTAEGESVDSFLEGHPEELAAEPMSLADMACWIYTSGTTGKPKGAVHCQRDVTLADLHMRENLGVKPGDRIYSTSKMFFAYALGHSLLGGLRSGATVILYQGWPDAKAVAEVVERHRPDVVFTVPTLYRNLLRHGVAGNQAFARVRHYVSAGEKLPEQIFEKWREATGVTILEGIGASEAMHLFIANTAREHRGGSCGKTLPWAEVRLMNEETGTRITEPDTPGLLWVKMDSMFDRYWNQPEKTREAFHGAWYRTGDMFTFDAQGWWIHQGRGDEMLKISGQWVSPVEIEECAQKMPQLSDAAAVGVPNAEGLVRSALFVVASNGGSGGRDLEDEIGAWLRERLSIYKCPRTIRFVEEIPRTPTGKIQRFKLAEQLTAEPA